MNWKEFIIELLKLISVDIGVGFLLYIIWRYLDLKYFSKLEIIGLKEENKYLKEENRKVGGANNFWEEDDLK